MLVLSRAQNDGIMIGDDILIVVVEIRGDKVRLGFQAPPEVPVHRREVYERIRRGEVVEISAEPSEGDGGGFLVLSRKKSEIVMIRDDISVTVVEIRGNKVRLGVEAPKEVPVHRKEVFDAIHHS